MPWFKVDDKIHSHKKPARAGLPSMGLWVLAGSWCAENFRTEGFIPDYITARLDPEYATHAAALVAAGLWIVAEHDGDQGWRFHDWLKFQPSVEQVEEERRKARERMQNIRSGSGSVRPNKDRTSPSVTAKYNDPVPVPVLPSEVRGARASRGTRIPDGFAVTDDMREWAAGKGWGHLDLDDITESFVDYWRSVPGAKGVKLDWIATWHNWVKRDAGNAKVRPLRSEQEHKPVGIDMNNPANWRVTSND